ncbi:MAG TPA: hypothetical protein VHB48_17630, partial [Chitinophagaceae bacterium]|nr:hypothetical protein [Chitinophagaceae bacterium]
MIVELLKSLTTKTFKMERQFKTLAFVSQQTNDILLYFNGAKRRDAVTFCITNLVRLNSAAAGVKILL